MSIPATIGECLNAIAGGLICFPESVKSSAEDEFSFVRKVYHEKLLVVHPDKGGSAAAFRTVNSAFEVVRRVYESDPSVLLSTVLGNSAAGYETLLEVAPGPFDDYAEDATQREEAPQAPAAASGKRTAEEAFDDEEAAGEDHGEAEVKPPRVQHIKWDGPLLAAIKVQLDKGYLGRFPSTAVCKLLNMNLKDYIEQEYGLNFVVSVRQINTVLKLWLTHKAAGGTTADFHPFQDRSERLRQCASNARCAVKGGKHALNSDKWETSLWAKVDEVKRCTGGGSPIAAVGLIFYENGCEA